MLTGDVIGCELASPGSGVLGCTLVLLWRWVLFCPLEIDNKPKRNMSLEINDYIP
jgi:hypothetical protein